MRVIDDGASRADLVLRREVKYALPGADVGTLRGLLEASCRRAVYNEPVSVVRSIYFDDWRLSACQENLSSVGTRRKVRVRWYDRREPPAEFFFEVKWRQSLLTGKHRTQVLAAEALADMPYRRIVSELAAVLPVAHREALLAAPEPTVAIEYKREHFVSYDGALRVTLDYDLVFYDELGKWRPSLAFGLPMHDMVVVEGKGLPGAERGLRMLLHPFAPRATRSSKYVHACRLLGVLAGTAAAFD